MKHQYLAESFLKSSLQQFVDFFVDLYAKLFIRKDDSREFTEPKNILFISLAHLGDALIGSYVFPLIKERYPNAQIDVLAGEWCSPVLRNNQYINNIIFFNHFRMNRSELSLWEKMLTHLKTSRSALKTIRSNQYDLSIEGRVSHPNGNLMAYRGKVKRRIGFGSGGFGSLLTEEVLFPPTPNFHMLEALLKELKIIGISKTLESIKPYFNVSNQSLQNPLVLDEYMNKPFIILHVETGKDYLSHRLIKNDFWLEFVRIVLRTTDMEIIVCGISQKSSELFEFLLLNISGAEGRILNAVKKLSLDEFFLLCQDASASITVDSLPAHLCAVNSITISIYKNGFGSLYFPISNKKTYIIHNHQASKDIRIHPNITNYYVKDIESQETYKHIKEIVFTLVH